MLSKLISLAGDAVIFLLEGAASVLDGAEKVTSNMKEKAEVFDKKSDEELIRLIQKEGYDRDSSILALGRRGYTPETISEKIAQNIHDYSNEKLIDMVRNSRCKLNKVAAAHVLSERGYSTQDIL
ncbi:hypothetical protein A6A19_05035 [Actinobacillus delphinicola]|uniref:hypothetical protein n=1 Tax=Actinobacillus delphinicola TaxID=51161 RepID=UPI002441B075|nr:hypothetical protein [Actinobacillus delphinicola]MDG6897368.1 hypothetical protein [Actinobacillus delphinicola]